MSYTSFPTTIIERIRKTPVFNTNIINYGNKVEQRIANSSTPQYKFNVKFMDAIEDKELDEIMLFFIDRKGSFEAFYLQNPEEFYRETKWKALTTYVVGNIVRPVTPNRRSYKCTVAGESGSSEPTWPIAVGGTVADGAVTWKENTYLVRFETDLINADFFSHLLYNLGEIALIEVAA